MIKHERLKCRLLMAIHGWNFTPSSHNGLPTESPVILASNFLILSPFPYFGFCFLSPRLLLRLLISCGLQAPAARGTSALLESFPPLAVLLLWDPALLGHRPFLLVFLPLPSRRLCMSTSALCVVPATTSMSYWSVQLLKDVLEPSSFSQPQGGISNHRKDILVAHHTTASKKTCVKLNTPSFPWLSKSSFCTCG